MLWRRARAFEARFRTAAKRPSAEDLVQEAYLHLISSDARVLRRFDPLEGSLDAYVAIVADNVFRSWLREEIQVKRGGTQKNAEIDPDAPSASDEARLEERTDAVMTARALWRHVIATQSARVQLIFKYHFGDGLSREEIASALGVSVQVVDNNLHKIREIARTFLARARRA